MKHTTFIFRTVISVVIILFCASELKAQCPADSCDHSLPKCNDAIPKVRAALEQCDIVPAISSKCTVKVIGDTRRIKANGIPDHPIGVFGTTDVGPCGRPNELKEQNYHFIIPANSGISKLGTKKYEFIKAPDQFGIAINGIPFDPEAAEWYMCNPKTGWQKSALNHPDMKYDTDCNHAHIQGNGSEHPGAYHYHGLPSGLYEKNGGTYPMPEGSMKELINRKTVMLGWAFDGAPVYGPLCYKKPAAPSLPNWWQPKSGWVVKAKPDPLPNCTPEDAYKGYYDEDYIYLGRPGTLDKCNGHFAATPENPEGIYHYHITLDYPHIPRCFTKMAH